MSAMWHHARLLRAVLLLTSVMTLTGVHVQHDRTPDGWRVARLVPLTITSIAVAGNLAYIFSVTDRAYELMFSLCLNTSNTHGCLMLAFLICYRRRIHALLGQVARLERATVSCSPNGSYHQVISRAVLLFAIPTFCFSFWVIGFFAAAELQHPFYILSWYIPSALQTPDWYGVITATQVLSGFISNFTQMAFDVLLAGLAESMTLFQERLETYCQKHLSCTDGASPHPAILSDALPEEMSKPAAEGQTEEVGESFNFKLPGLNQVGVWIVRSGGAAHAEPERTDRLPSERLEETGEQKHMPELEWRLEQLATTYGCVRQLAADAASVCSVATLSLHASLTGGLLLGSYVSILMLYRGEATSVPQLIGFVAFTLGMVLRVLVVSCAGSRLMAGGERLHQTLAALRWPPAVSAAARFQLQQLLEQTRRPPALDGWGLFTVQNSNMLGLFSFVLTYFVILVQMKVH